jgi:hypothetical protein
MPEPVAPTLNVADWPSQYVWEASGCAVISAFSVTVKAAFAEVAAGVQVPLTTT